MEARLQRPPLERGKSKQNSSVSPMRDREAPLSRFEVMKSKRHQLNTILSDYVEPGQGNIASKGLRKQPSNLKNKFANRNLNHQKSNSVHDELPMQKVNSKFLLSEYSQFLQHSGMTDIDPFRKSVSPENDRNNDVSDIPGAAAYNKQLSTTKPINTDYDKLETFKNNKKTFLMRRAEAGNVNSKRCMRIDDIEGALPKPKNAITDAQRNRITSADLKDLITDIEKYRNRQLAKNGFINLCPRSKPPAPNKQQTFNLFDTSLPEEGYGKGIRDTITPRRDVGVTLDQIGLHRAKNKQYKSQPRNIQYHTKDNSAQRNPISHNFPQAEVDFSKKNSQRQERLSKYYFKPPTEDQKPRKLVRELDKITLPGKRNLQEGTFDGIKHKKVDRAANQSALAAPKNTQIFNTFLNQDKREVTPSRRVLRPYQNRVGAGEDRTSTAYRDRSVGATYDSRNIHPHFDVKKNMDDKIYNKDVGLIKNQLNLKIGGNKSTQGIPVQHLNPIFTGSISHNEQLLNKMFHQRRNEQERLNKNSFMGLV